jgi:hypothetical protein
MRYAACRLAQRVTECPDLGNIPALLFCRSHLDKFTFEFLAIELDLLHFIFSLFIF